MQAKNSKIYTVCRNIFGKNLSPEHKLFLWVGGISMVICFGAGVANYIVHRMLIYLIAPTINMLINAGCVVCATIEKKWKPFAIVSVFSTVMLWLPSLWVSCGGMRGAVLPFAMLMGIVAVSILSGKTRVFAVSLIAAEAITFIFLEYYIPDIYVPFENRSIEYYNILISVVFSFAASAGLMAQVLHNYNKAKTQTEMLIVELERASLTDPLTGVSNRRFLTACLDEEMRKAYDSGDALSVCILDVDFFKKINDTHGHPYGDVVLIGISDTIKASLGENEVFGRYGGEEFLIILKNSRLIDAAKIVEKTCAAVSAVVWEHGEPVTLSAGLAGYSKGITYSSFLKTADENLYRAKQGGRNRVVM